jgi:hypothetical protein
MPADDALLFIDANKYLDLYRTDKGKKLLAPLGEQVDHIFVTQQVVNDFQRNKIQVAACFLEEKLKDFKLQTFRISDLLFGTRAGQSKSILEKMDEIEKKIKKGKRRGKWSGNRHFGADWSVGRRVIKGVGPIFPKVVPHTRLVGYAGSCISAPCLVMSLPNEEQKE